MCGESIHLIGSISLFSPPVAGVWWAHTLDWLYDSLSSPPVSGVWWEHTLDWLYDSLSSPPVAGVWWVHTLDWLYVSLFSTCSWCVVSAYTWLALWLSLFSTCSWCVVRAYTWLALWLSLLSTCGWCVVSALAPLSCGSHRTIQVDATHWWWFEERPPHTIVKHFGWTPMHNKALYKCIIHSFKSPLPNVSSHFYLLLLLSFQFSFCHSVCFNFIFVSFSSVIKCHWWKLWWKLSVNIITLLNTGTDWPLGAPGCLPIMPISW